MKDCDQSEKNVDLCEHVQEHVRKYSLLAGAEDFPEWNGLKVKNRDCVWVGGTSVPASRV